MEQENVNVHFAISFVKETLRQMKEYVKRFIEQIRSSKIFVSRDKLHISLSKMVSSDWVYVKIMICSDYINHRQ
jgi:hypothetical protein